jgi:hypothetical protein
MFTLWKPTNVFNNALWLLRCMSRIMYHSINSGNRYSVAWFVAHFRVYVAYSGDFIIKSTISSAFEKRPGAPFFTVAHEAQRHHRMV